MAVTQTKVRSTDPIGIKVLLVPITTAISQTNKSVLNYVPGFAGIIEKVILQCSTLAGTCTVEVRTGGTAFGTGARSACTATAPVADANTVATLSSTLANKKFSATEAIRVGYTTNGSGALTNGYCIIHYRPFPMNGDAG